MKQAARKTKKLVSPLVELEVDHRKGDELGDVVVGNGVVLVEVDQRKEVGGYARAVDVLGRVLEDHQRVVDHNQIKGAQDGHREQRGREGRVVFAAFEGPLEVW